MRLSEALAILKARPEADRPAFQVFLVCGFTPLHLQTFLSARLQMALPGRRIQIHTGLFGDFPGNLERCLRCETDSCAIVMEWADLDARLGLRGLGGWRLTDFEDILACVQSRLAWIEDRLAGLSQRSRVAICLLMLSLPPIQAAVPTWKSGVLDLSLRQMLSWFALRAAQNQNVSIVNPEWLDRISPSRDRLDVKSEVLTGFPYSLPHADAAADLLSNLIQRPAPKKGLITDLDDTLWKGIVGEAGPDSVFWDLDRKAHMHGLYQELLRSLGAAGVLIAVASKNDMVNVEPAFERSDMILTKDHIYPFEVHWKPKSQSVTRILEAWNIGPESVIFVDDSPAELAEVRAVHPEVECLQFPADPQEVYEMILRIRNFFAKGAATEEDRLRLASIRGMNSMRESMQGAGAAPEAFLAQAEGELTLSSDKTPWDPRVFELLNKTNQFNLNGRRYIEADLKASLTASDSFLLKASYKDKYGTLGKIAAILGRTDGATLYIDAWVMSCRAFSRRIEHECLVHLVEKFAPERICFDFVKTLRNKPLQDFFLDIAGQAPAPALRLSREQILNACSRGIHRVLEEVNG
jgi:FkbH-like protein